MLVIFLDQVINTCDEAIFSLEKKKVFLQDSYYLGIVFNAGTAGLHLGGGGIDI